MLTTTEKNSAKALAREVAGKVIKNNPYLWDELKDSLFQCQNADAYGSHIHMAFLNAVKTELHKLTDYQRLLLKTHIVSPPHAMWSASYADLINGQIFSRAKAVITRS